MKDEAPYLLEWFAHHMAVGFTDILVYTNDCSDGTDAMLMRLEELGLGHHRRNDIPEGRKPQPSALKHAQQEPIVQDSDWVLVFDADEFLCINLGDGTLDTLISAAGQANGIVITWRIFGSGQVQDWSREPVSEQYLMAAPPLWNKGWGVKTMFKFDPDYWKLGIHRPSIKAKHLESDFPDSVNWLNGSGLPMEDYFKYRGWRSIRRTVGYDWAQINHYAVKSIDAYAVRKFRGNVNLKADKYNADYWALQDRNEVRDTSALRYQDKRAAIVTELLKDPVLNTLHFAALEKVEARLNAFRGTEDYKKLKSDLIEASKIPITKLEAKPPKARDPAKIAALMSAVERKSAERAKDERKNKPVAAFGAGQGKSSSYVAGKIDRSTEVPFETVANHEILLPADPRVLNPDAMQDVATGKFERRSARFVGRWLAPGDRLLFLGSGICFLPILALRQHPGLIVLAHESRSDLAKVGREVARQNDAGDTSCLKIVDGPLVFETDAGDQASGLLALVRDFKPTVINVGDPRVSGTALCASLIPSVRRIILQEHVASFSPGKLPGYSQLLSNAGFSMLAGSEKSGSAVFDRTPVAGWVPRPASAS